MMRIAVQQAAYASGSLPRNLTFLNGAAAAARAEGADLLIMPELALQGYGAGAAMTDAALTAEEVVSEIAALPDLSGLALIAGFAERGRDCLYNSAIFLDAEGSAPVIYRKSHLYGAYEQALFRRSRPGTVVVEVGGLKIGILICYDVEFPENVRRLAQAGADLIAVPTALPAAAEARFIARQMIPVRAFENQVFVAYANHCGHDGAFSYAGLSAIVAPDGHLLAAAEAEGEALIMADIDPSAYAASRERNAYLRDL